MWNNKRKIIVALLVLILAAGSIGLYMYNKEGPDVNNAGTIKVTAPELYELFTKDSVSAKQKYAEQILNVTGEVSGVSKNQQDNLIILLKTNNPGASINCTMEGPAGSLKNGNKISMKGICKGIGQGDADLGIAPDVYLSRCYLGK